MTAASLAPRHPIRGEIIENISAERDAWLARGLCTRRSDRTSAESAVAQLYRLCGLARPEFVWVPSPPAGATLIEDENLAESMSFAEDRLDLPPTCIAARIRASFARMDARIERRRSDWAGRHSAIEAARSLPPKDALGRGIDPDLVLRASMWDSLRTSLFDGVASAVRTLMPPVVCGVTWYGQQEAHRVGHYDVYRRSGLVTFGYEDVVLLDVLSVLTDSTGWWWAFDGVCVMSERPTALRTEPTPGGVHNQRRLHEPDRPALEFADGTAVFVLHGTIVPDWVVLDPSVERISAERNVEVRRCAIERIGWDSYIDAAGLELIDRSDDPGNPGCMLQLYTTPDGWGRRSRILLAVNGSRERDGHRRRYGLHVPHWMPSAMDAAGWTYGISGADYADLLRRT
ncbi:DUF6745 domain-containing protein [Rhodococcoides yunnanense]|uniref:DUF6745 domain-containing protein n=1 Tax=Rhodococcoides yunnanense TaxID=278209 RepID=UPI001FEB935E|nr:hypothetical protein [Rhodococcus yunnanensis]